MVAPCPRGKGKPKKSAEKLPVVMEAVSQYVTKEELYKFGDYLVEKLSGRFTILKDKVQKVEDKVAEIDYKLCHTLKQVGEIDQKLCDTMKQVSLIEDNLLTISRLSDKSRLILLVRSLLVGSLDRTSGYHVEHIVREKIQHLAKAGTTSFLYFSNPSNRDEIVWNNLFDICGHLHIEDASEIKMVLSACLDLLNLAEIQAFVLKDIKASLEDIKGVGVVLEKNPAKHVSHQLRILVSHYSEKSSKAKLIAVVVWYCTKKIKSKRTQKA